jgi:hypothetical protein
MLHDVFSVFLAVFAIDDSTGSLQCADWLD